MSEVALPGSIEPAGRKDLGGAINSPAAIIFEGALAGVVLSVAYSICTRPCGRI